MKKNALLLSGGGARAAYQVGVVKALDDHMNTQSSQTNLFDIFCGVSAGGINSLGLASNNERRTYAIDRLVSIWEKFEVEQVYRTDNISLLKSAYPWLRTLIPFRKNKPLANYPMSFLDNSPLEKLLNIIEYDKLDNLVAQQKLYATSVTCSSYHTGQSVTFYQGHTNIQEWEKERKLGVRDKIGSAHLLASSALPMIFPAHKIKNEWFGDGSMRQHAPLSAPIHLGADRIFVIGTGINTQFLEKSLVSNSITFVPKTRPYPSLAQIGGHILNGLFVDSLFSDIDRLKRTNEMIKLLPQDNNFNLRPIDLMIINPSRKIDEIASQFVHELPESILKLLSRVGATERLGGGLASYLLFQSSYCKELIQIGYEDAWGRRQEIVDFLTK